MKIFLDNETQGFDAQNLIVSVLITERAKKPEIYYKGKDVWNRIIQLGINEAKRGKVLNVYAHKHEFDFYGYANLKDKHIRILTRKPLIAGYYLKKEELKKLKIKIPTKTEIIKTNQIKEWKNKNHFRKIIKETQMYNGKLIKIQYEQNSKEIIKFLDTAGIFRTDVEGLGKMVKLQKKEMPKKLLKKQITGTYTKKELKEITEYCKTDVEIIKKGIEKIQEILKKEKNQVRRLITISQIQVNGLIKDIKKTGQTEHIFKNQKIGITHETFREKEIHEAYRGGILEAFRIGKFENTTYIDINSLYPYSATKIKFPDLRTERKIWKPLKKITINKLLKYTGVSQALVKNESEELPILAVRTSTGSYYPKKNTYIIGTWTHEELKEAKRIGYKIIQIGWSVIYLKNGYNPFKQIMNKYYKLRKKEKEPLRNYFYKTRMNDSIGKLAQYRTGNTLVIDSIEKATEYLKENYKIVKGIEKSTNVIYMKEEKRGYRKNYYMPIIPVIINAKARIIIRKELQKIYEKNKTDLLYTDTDSIIFKGNHLKKFKIGERLGEFKIEKNKKKNNKPLKNVESVIYGKKSKMVDGIVTMAGVNPKQIKPSEFKKGKIKYERMITINTAKTTKEIGKFKKDEINLKELSKRHKKIQEKYEKSKIMLDNNIKGEDIEEYLEKLTEIEKENILI